MTDTPREPDNREHPDQGEFPHSQADTPVRTDDGEPSRLSASPHKKQPPPDSPDTDLVLGDATGVVLTFSSTHGFIHTDRFGSIFVHTSGLGDGTTRLEPGQWVSARILHGRKGIYAYQVQVLTPDTVTTGDAPLTRCHFLIRGGQDANNQYDLRAKTNQPERREHPCPPQLGMIA